MGQAMGSENACVVDLLITLHNEKFTPLAWWHFLGRSWDMSWRTANAHPTLKRSWIRVTLFISVLALALVITSFVLEGTTPALHLLPGFLFCVAWQQSDLFWHLGLNRHGGKLLPVVGIANTCTWLRALGASFLIGRLVGGVNTPSWLALLVFLSGIATDILDGQLARRTGTQSTLGQIGDGEADFCLYSAIAIILIQNSVLPLWLGLIMLLRFFIPLLAALGSYFLFAHPVHFGSTVWGKYAGLAQCLYFLVLLAPPHIIFITTYAQLPLLVITLVLLVVAPMTQILNNVRMAR